MKDKQAKIYKSIWGNTWYVEECIGSTLYYQHFDTYEEAINYSKNNELEIIDIPKVTNEVNGANPETFVKKNEETIKKRNDILQRLRYEICGFQKVMEVNDTDAQIEKGLGHENWQMFYEGRVDAYGLIISILKEIIKDYDGKDL